MSVLSSIVRNSTILALGLIVAKGLVFVSTILLTRRLGVEGFGLYAWIFAYLAFFEIFADAGLDTRLVREATKPGSAARRLGDAYFLRIALIFLVAPVAIYCARFKSSEWNVTMLVALAILPWFSSTRRTSLRSLLDVPYRVNLRMGVPTMFQAGSETIHLALLGPLVAIFGLPGAVAAQGLSALPLVAFQLRGSWREFRPEFHFDPERLKSVARSTLPWTGGILLNVVLVRADVIMLDLMTDAEVVGLYAAASRLVETANLIPPLLITSVFPLLAASHPNDPLRVTRLFVGSLRILAAVVVPFILVLSFYPSIVVHRLFGADFADAASLLPWLAPVALLVFADMVLTARLLATGQESRNAHLVLCAAATNVALNLTLIPRWGPVGAAVATLVAYFVRLTFGGLWPDVRTAIRETWRALLPPALLGGAAVGAGAILEGILVPAGWWALLLYGSAIVTYHALRAQDRELLVRIVEIVRR